MRVSSMPWGLRRVIVSTIAVLGLVVVALTSVPAAHAAPGFSFSTGNPDGLIAMASRPSGSETEAADDFVLGSDTTITHASFVGLLPSGASLSTILSVAVKIYRVFPLDSASPPSGHVPTRVNSPSDTAFATRTGQGASFTASVLASSFSAANSVDNGINPIPNQTTGGQGAVSGEEVTFDVAFSPPLSLAADHYFFVPEVGLSAGQFFWLSAPKPIVAPGTPFAPDLQTWIRNTNVSPDWLRVGTDIVGGPTTFNGTFSLSGSPPCPTITVVPAALPGGVPGSPYAAVFTASGGSAPYAFSEIGVLPAGVSLSAATLSGTPSQAGTFPLAITATDTAGCQATVTPTLTIMPAAGSGGGHGSGPGRVATPAVGALKASPSVFRAASAGGSFARRRKTGTTISYTDSEAAVTSFTVLVRARGFRAGTRCVRRRPHGHKRLKRCPLLIPQGSFSHHDRAGSNSFHFTGRARGRALKPLRYQLRALPRANGRLGKAATAAFRIIR